MDFGVVSGVITAVLLITFLAGVAWAWSARQKPAFDAAARLPLEDNEVKP
ncbi:MAG: CcoQ/FixQ family Cbb3-type cytochrome c oxidase assembly chaperone [Rhodanobacteraceae bacterium]|jgi:cytochrome c oxidase cbb3-type subunit 4|nr:CcoQ/FixQ family Cbb3-type cytochrome c oxidase assembly chaperone [Rhodanobacteraceae bacterium]MBL0040781.1 CcoQ/FixQ family Cbb3-type cytochrome c oxidase assembly chaperone [Xanthomonadales bacterium]